MIWWTGEVIYDIFGGQRWWTRFDWWTGVKLLLFVFTARWAVMKIMKPKKTELLV